MPLLEADIEQFESLLFSDEVSEDALDYFGWHGLIAASVVGPTRIDSEALVRITFGDDSPPLTDRDLQLFEKCTRVVESDLNEGLTSGTSFILPFEEEELYEDAMESWCCGFMEGFFYNEKAWFGKGEEVTAELLLPVMALSGLFDDNEFQEICKNEKIMAQFAEQIPDLLVDIFLFYHSE